MQGPGKDDAEEVGNKEGVDHVGGGEGEGGAEGGAEGDAGGREEGGRERVALRRESCGRRAKKIQIQHGC